MSHTLKLRVRRTLHKPKKNIKNLKTAFVNKNYNKTVVYTRAGSISLLTISIFIDTPESKISAVSISIFFTAALFGLQTLRDVTKSSGRFSLWNPDDDVSNHLRCGTLSLSDGYFCHFHVKYYVVNDVKVSNRIANSRFGSAVM